MESITEGNSWKRKWQILLPVYPKASESVFYVMRRYGVSSKYGVTNVWIVWEKYTGYSNGVCCNRGYIRNLWSNYGLSAGRVDDWQKWDQSLPCYWGIHPQTRTELCINRNIETILHVCPSIESIAAFRPFVSFSVCFVVDVALRSIDTRIILPIKWRKTGS
jgi:hypothetical protein